jgi:predicted nucleotidyltransferase
MDQKSIISSLKNINQKYNNYSFEIVSLFGSYARDENDIFSDIDLTYKIDHNKFYKDDAFEKLKKLEYIKSKLEKTFHKKVDLVPYKFLNKHIGANILKEQILIKSILDE